MCMYIYSVLYNNDIVIIYHNNLPCATCHYKLLVILNVNSQWWVFSIVTTRHIERGMWISCEQLLK